MTTLGKRHRNSSSLRRTTSMSGFAAPGEEQPARAARGGSAAPAPATEAGTGTGMGWGAVQRWNSADCHAAAEDTAPFLKACGLCSRRLGPGRDTFIYMGEVAFCSLECRQEQMNIDDLKEKKCFPPAGSGGSDQSGSTVAAA